MGAQSAAVVDDERRIAQPKVVAHELPDVFDAGGSHVGVAGVDLMPEGVEQRRGLGVARVLPHQTRGAVDAPQEAEHAVAAARGAVVDQLTVADTNAVGGEGLAPCPTDVVGTFEQDAVVAVGQIPGVPVLLGLDLLAEREVEDDAAVDSLHAEAPELTREHAQILGLEQRVEAAAKGDIAAEGVGDDLTFYI